MGKIIDDIFEIQADGEDFEKTDRMISEECSRLLQDFKEHMLPLDYEKMRDAVFSVSFLAKKAAFEIGFKTALNLVLECRDKK